MLGMASGIFIVPILTMFGHIEIHTAIGASIVSSRRLLVRGGAAPSLRNRLTNVRLAIVLENRYDSRRFDRGAACRHRAGPSFYIFLFAGILFLSAQQNVGPAP